jgi:hypothetical protein
MMAFNMNDYEDVATLNKWFIGNYPVNGYILVQATLWRDAKDATPAVSNIAFGSRETYIPNMKKFYVEDTATSALGRAIIILKGSDKTATKDDMRKVENEPLKNNYGKSGNAQLIELALTASVVSWRCNRNHTDPTSTTRMHTWHDDPKRRHS